MLLATAMASVFLSGVRIHVGLIGRLMMGARGVVGGVETVGMAEGGWYVLCLK